jgi:hypothetical protein
MAESDVDICNRALASVGSTKLIEALDQTGSTEAEQCLLWYERLRDEILRDRVWKFATRRATLALVAGETRTDWGFVYALPSNCLQVRGLVLPGARSPWMLQGYPFAYYQGATSYTGVGVPASNKTVPFDIEARVDPVTDEVIGKVLLCDMESAELVYTVRVTNPQAFDPDFEAALELYLASKLALALPKDTARSRELMNEYLVACRKAGANSVNEETADPEGASTFEASRR